MARRKTNIPRYDKKHLNDGFVPKDLNPFELEQSDLTIYEPVAKAVIGRVWTDIMRREWKDHKGKTYPSAYFKLFLWSGEEKYRCTILFEQADEVAARIKKGDWVLCFGMDDLVKTQKGKRYHNFRVVKLWTLPPQKGIFDVRGLLEIFQQLLDGFQEQQRRLEWLESEIKALTGHTPDEQKQEKAPRGDAEKLKKRQSLRNIVGDIYIDTDDKEEEE